MKTKLITIALGLIAACAFAAPTFADERAVNWSGQVDDTILVRIHGPRVDTRTIHGKDPWNVTAVVSEPLPDRPVHVWLSNIGGRGSVELVREPSPDNDFTAVVRIKDPQSGSGYYHFTLNWDGGGRRFGGGDRDGDRHDDDDNR